MSGEVFETDAKTAFDGARYCVLFENRICAGRRVEYRVDARRRFFWVESCVCIESVCRRRISKASAEWDADGSGFEILATIWRGVSVARSARSNARSSLSSQGPSDFRE